MKKTVIASAMTLLCGVAFAQGYVGAVVSLTSIGTDCSGVASCDKKGRGGKVYFGTKFAKANQLDFGIGSVDSLEFGVVTFGKGATTYTKQYLDANTSTTYDLDASTSNTANALVGTVVVRLPLFDGAAVTVRPGLAYVSSTQRYYVAGAQNGSETATKLKPYLGLGIEFSLFQDVRVVGAFDWTKFDVADHHSSLKAFGVGAEIGF